MEGKYLVLLMIFVLSACDKETRSEQTADGILQIPGTNISALYTLNLGAEKVGLLAVTTKGETLGATLLAMDTEGNVRDQYDMNLAGIPHEITAGDTDGDGHSEIFIGYGMGRGKLEDPVKVLQYSGKKFKEIETIFEMKSPRAEITALQPLLDGSLALFYFDSKYFVQTGKLMRQNNKWEFIKEDRIRLATSLDLADWDNDGTTDFLIGKPYGDVPGADGYPLLRDANGEHKLPSFRGVRIVRFAQLDQDPELEIVIGDGWHQNYGKIAEPRLTMLNFDGTQWQTKLLDTVSPQYSIEKIEIIGTGEQAIIVAAGDRMITTYAQAENWSRKELFSAKEMLPWDFAVIGSRIAIASGDTISFLSP